MTTPESLRHDPDVGGALRGAALILLIGGALGIAYNAVGLASRPRHGLAWIKTAPKLESLEAIQSTPATAEAAGSQAAPTPGSAEAAAGHATPAASPKPGVKRPDATAAAPSRAGEPAPAPSTGPTPPLAAGAAPAGASATPAADLPVIPDVPGPLKLEIATLKRLHDASAALVLDAREAAEYAEGHIGGAISLPYNDALAEPERVKKLDPAGRPIVIYCSGGDCELSMDLAKVLIESGKRRVLIYEGGFPEWQAAGYAVARGPNP